ncbi:ankyrin [Acephala macrosclerotiorum]|nr:ankyrin [Acephala macrosclerotiorum]
MVFKQSVSTLTMCPSCSLINFRCTSEIGASNRNSSGAFSNPTSMANTASSEGSDASAACPAGHHSPDQSPEATQILHPDNARQLLFAAANGHEAEVRSLLEGRARANVEAENDGGDTPLLLAAENGHEGVLKALLDYKAKIEAQTIEGYTPLLLAAQIGHEGVLKVLLSYKANTEATSNRSKSTALMYAACNGHEIILTMLLDRGANIEAKRNDGYTALLIAASCGHEAALKVLINRQANIEAKSDRGHTALAVAIYFGHIGVVKVLLDEGTNIEAKYDGGYTALLLAASRGHEAVLKVLLNRQANIEAKSDRGHTALAVAIYFGHIGAVKVLLDGGANIMAKDEDGTTALMHAATSEYEAVSKMLLMHIATMNPSLLRPTPTNNDFPIKVAIYVHSRYCKECFTVPVSHQVLLLPRDVTMASSLLDLIAPAFQTHPNFYDGNHKHDPFFRRGANTTGDIERYAVKNFHKHIKGAKILVLWPNSSPGNPMRTAITAENFKAMFTLLQARPGEAVLGIFIGWSGPVDFDTSKYLSVEVRERGKGVRYY